MVPAMRKRAFQTSQEKLAHVLRIDSEIKHLETVLRGRREPDLLAHDYWRQRIMQALSTPGLLPSQMKRLESLLMRLGGRDQHQVVGD